MKNFFNKIKSYGFWVSLSSALVLLTTALGKAFGFEIEHKIIEDVVMSVAGVLAVLGIVSMNKKQSTQDDEQKIEGTKEIEDEKQNDEEKESE